MSAPAPRSTFTVDEYLEHERAADERRLYVDGELFAMAGESGAHADVSANIVIALGRQLRGSRCRVRTKDTKVRSGPPPKGAFAKKGMCSYPDVLVICGEPEYHDQMKDIVLNPKVIIEVLSEHTEPFDRGEKFQRYQQWNPSLTDYVLVSQLRPEIEHFTKQDHGGWLYQRFAGLDAVVELPSIGCRLPLAEAYERLAFPPAPE